MNQVRGSVGDDPFPAVGQSASSLGADGEAGSAVDGAAAVAVALETDDRHRHREQVAGRWTNDGP